MCPTREILAKKMVEITGMHKAFFSNSGAEAIDGALKLARVRTEKKKFVAFIHGFHGRTIGSLAVTHKPCNPGTVRTARDSMHLCRVWRS